MQPSAAVEAAAAAANGAMMADMSNEVTSTFYNGAAREWVRLSSVSASHGASMMTRLDEEYDRITQSPINNFGVLAYGTQLNEVYKVLGDAMMSAVHRSVFHYHVNRCAQGSGMHIPTDEEELQVSNDPITDSEDEDQDSISDVEEVKKPQVPQIDAKSRKREDAKKRRMEDDELLLNERKVRDEKNNLMVTVGPFPPPRLTIRSLKPGRAIPSRKALTQRTVVDNSDSSSESDIDDGKLPAAPGPSNADVDTVSQLVAYLAPLSLDSLKKMSESAKVKLRGNCTQEEAVSEIVKAAVKMGCEKACVLMDKNKMLDKVAAHASTSRAHVLAQLATSIPTFLKTLPDELLRSLGPTLGIPSENSTVAEMWERIVAMGFCAVLTHLRPRPLKKMGQELNITLNDNLSTEKHCEMVVFNAFPRERIRVRQSRLLKKTPGVCFRVIPNRCRCHGDMGFIDFAVINVSSMRQDNDRHYSPEFEFANLRWSLLCMANKDALALYLCQQGTVHCKFIISIVNMVDPDSTVYNEGTQKFSSASAENDWGFNNVVKFEYLLDQKNGFWSVDTDSITISVGIVLVEALNKAPSSVIPLPSAVSKTVQAQPKAAKTTERIVESVANQLLETERMENLRKKIKADMVKWQKEEDKQRKEWIAKQQKAFQQLFDQHAQEKNKIAKELSERERREQQERMREQERLRQMQEQNEELKRKVTEFSEENNELNHKKKVLTNDIKEEKRRLDSLKVEVSDLDAQLAVLQAEIEAADAQLAAKNQSKTKVESEIADLERRLSAPRKRGGAASGGRGSGAIADADEHQFEVDFLHSVQQSLATIGIHDLGM